MYICIYVYIHIYIYMYIHIYIYTYQVLLVADKWVNTNGPAAKVMNFDRLEKGYALALLGR